MFVFIMFFAISHNVLIANDDITQDTGLLLWYTFDEGSGSTVSDSAISAMDNGTAKWESEGYDQNIIKGYNVRGSMSVDMPSNWFLFHPIQSRESHEAIINRAEHRVPLHGKNTLFSQFGNMFKLAKYKIESFNLICNKKNYQKRKSYD
ncbi:hypothetical protein MHK_008297 [Candidatus Magnetomorum sp. HK-1]|nr:hypothetical protein MHK_008297 [Candidatus Magnetomorum sp. HK-1]